MYNVGINKTSTIQIKGALTIMAIAPSKKSLILHRIGLYTTIWTYQMVGPPQAELAIF